MDGLDSRRTAALLAMVGYCAREAHDLGLQFTAHLLGIAIRSLESDRDQDLSAPPETKGEANKDHPTRRLSLVPNE